MLKLEQINIVDPDSLIVEVLEPVVYDKVGTVLKTDETIAREKANTVNLLAKVRTSNVHKDDKPNYHVNDILMISKHSLSPITFPVEGYDMPKLAIIHIDSVIAIIEDEDPITDFPAEN